MSVRGPWGAGGGRAGWNKRLFLLPLFMFFSPTLLLCLVLSLSVHQPSTQPSEHLPHTLGGQPRCMHPEPAAASSTLALGHVISAFLGSARGTECPGLYIAICRQVDLGTGPGTLPPSSAPPTPSQMVAGFPVSAERMLQGLLGATAGMLRAAGIFLSYKYTGFDDEHERR